MSGTQSKLNIAKSIKENKMNSFMAAFKLKLTQGAITLPNVDTTTIKVAKTKEPVIIPVKLTNVSKEMKEDYSKGGGGFLQSEMPTTTLAPTTTLPYNPKTDKRLCVPESTVEVGSTLDYCKGYTPSRVIYDTNVPTGIVSTFNKATDWFDKCGKVPVAGQACKKTTGSPYIPPTTTLAPYDPKTDNRLCVPDVDVHPTVKVGSALDYCNQFTPSWAAYDSKWAWVSKNNWKGHAESLMTSCADTGPKKPTAYGMSCKEITGSPYTLPTTTFTPKTTLKLKVHHEYSGGEIVIKKSIFHEQMKLVDPNYDSTKEPGPGYIHPAQRLTYTETTPGEMSIAGIKFKTNGEQLEATLQKSYTKPQTYNLLLTHHKGFNYHFTLHHKGTNDDIFEPLRKQSFTTATEKQIATGSAKTVPPEPNIAKFNSAIEKVLKHTTNWMHYWGVHARYPGFIDREGAFEKDYPWRVNTNEGILWRRKKGKNYKNWVEGGKQELENVPAVKTDIADRIAKGYLKWGWTEKMIKEASVLEYLFPIRTGEESVLTFKYEPITI